MSLTNEQRAHDLAISQLNRVLEEKVQAEKNTAKPFDKKNISITQTYHQLYQGFLTKLNKMDF